MQLTASYQSGNGVIILTSPSSYAAPALDGTNFVNVPGDNLGNHTATKALNLQANPLIGTGTDLGTAVGVGITAQGGLNLGQNNGANLLLGYQAGQRLTPDLTDNGTGNGTGNQLVGYQAGAALTTGSGNQFEGFGSGAATTTGFANVFSGAQSGASNISGYYNQYLGYNAGARSTAGHDNLFVGYGSGFLNETGTALTALGSNAGPDRTHPGLTNATALGANATTTTSNTVVLGNAASVGIGTSEPDEKLQVVGTIHSSTGGFRFPDNTVQTTAAVSPTGANFILNQPTPQAGAAFNVAGAGTVGGLLTATGGVSLTGATAINASGTAGTTIGSSSSPVALPGLATAGLVTNTATGVLGTATPASLGGSFILNQPTPQASATFNVGGAGTVGGLLTAGSAAVAGNVGLGSNGAAPGTYPAAGNVVEFVGPAFNTDPVGLYRVNTGSDATQLRAVVGDAADAGDKFVVGRSSASGPGGIAAGTFTPSFTVQADGTASLGTVTAPDASAALDIVSSSKGALLPRLSASARLGISSPAPGLLVYQTDAPTSGTGAGTAAGFWYNSGAAATPRWVRLLTSADLSYSAGTGLQVGSSTAGPYVVNPDGANGQANGLPFGSGFSTDVKVQYLLRPDLLTAAGLAAGYLAELAIPLAAKGSTTPYLNLTLQLANTASTDLASSFATGLTTVYTAPAGGYSTVLGWNAFAFSQPFFWDGTSSLVVQVCYHNTSVGLGSDAVNNTFPAYGARLALYNNTSTPICGSTTPSVLGGGLPSFRFRQATGYTLPPVGGTAGQVLTQQASGSVAFQTPAWTQSGTSLYPSVLGSSVGLGTTSPATTLDVRTTDATAAILVGSTGGGYGALYFGNPNHGLRRNYSGGNDIGLFTTSGNLYLSANGNTATNQFALLNNGNVGIGTNTPVSGLHIDRPESSSTTALGVLLSGGSSGNPSLELRGSGSSPYIDFVENPGLDYSTRLLSLGGVLNVQRTSGSGTLLNVQGGLQCVGAVNTSDQRLKQDIRPLTGALAAVLALRGVRYTWNALGVQRGGTAGAEQVGVLAQEVEKVFPELVTTGPDGYKAVNYAQLTPVLIEALKQQQAQLEALKTQNAAARTALQAVQAQATATTEALEARLRRLEAAAGGQAQARP